MTEAYLVDGGEEHRLHNPNEGPDGEIVSTQMQQKAGLMGVLHLLDTIARRDENREFRLAARAQANVVRRLMGLKTKEYGGDVFAELSQLKLNAPVQAVLTIDGKTGDIS